MADFTLKLDTIKGQGNLKRVIVRQGETIPLRIEVTDDGVAYDFTDKYLDFACVRPDKHWIHVHEPFVHVGQTNIWEVELPVNVTAVAGDVDLAYFRIRSYQDKQFLLTTETIQIVVDPSATCKIKLGPYSDQLNSLIHAFEALVMAWQNKQIEFEDEFKLLLLDFRQMFQQAEADRNTAFDLAETRREHIYQDALEAINAALQGNFDPIAKLYLDSWYDKPGGIVSYDWFQEWQFKHGFVPFLDDETFLEVVFSD